MAESIDTAAIRAEWNSGHGGCQVIHALCDALDEVRAEAVALRGRVHYAAQDLRLARAQLAALPAWTCPSCGAETRARMADREFPADVGVQGSSPRSSALDAAARAYDAGLRLPPGAPL